MLKKHFYVQLQSVSFCLGFYLKYANFGFKMSSQVKTDPAILKGLKKRSWSQNLRSLSQKTKIWCNNAVSRRFGKYSFQYQDQQCTAVCNLLWQPTNHPATFPALSKLLGCQASSSFLVIYDHFFQTWKRIVMHGKLKRKFWRPAAGVPQQVSTALEYTTISISYILNCFPYLFDGGFLKNKIKIHTKWRFELDRAKNCCPIGGNGCPFIWLVATVTHTIYLCFMVNPYMSSVSINKNSKRI